MGHEPRHGTAHVSSWSKALENDPSEIRADAVDAQRISDWLLSCERESSLGDDKAELERPEGAAGRTPERAEQPALEVDGARQRRTRPRCGSRTGGRRGDPTAASAVAAPAMSEELKNVLRDMAAPGYRAG